MMEVRTNPIGGEFWWDSSLYDQDIQNDIYNEGTLLDGGKSAIEYILEDIQISRNEIILLPKYLCPTIVEIVCRTGIKYKFYDINEKLGIDVLSIDSLIHCHPVKAVLFINYFGFFHGHNTISFMKGLKEKGIIIIEDAVQMLWVKRQKDFIGDYIFNSYRKFLPLDGSIVLSSKKDRVNARHNKYFCLMEEARKKKTDYIINGVGVEEDFLRIFSEAHQAYYNEEQCGGMHDKYEKMLIKLPIERLIQQRRKNYGYLLKELSKVKEIIILYHIHKLGNNIPLAFPILIKDRDRIREELMNYNIYAPIHWTLDNAKWLDKQNICLEISRNILSLPIDWRYTIEDMKYMVKTLKEILNSMKEVKQ